MGGILDYTQSVHRGQILYLLHFTRHAGDVYRNDRFRPGGNPARGICRIQIHGVGLNVNQDWLRPQVADDFSFNNPKNPDVRGIGKREIQALFPGLEMKTRRITLAPPLGRIVAPFSIVLYYLLSRVRPLCTHLLCLLRKARKP